MLLLINNIKSKPALKSKKIKKEKSIFLKNFYSYSTDKEAIKTM